MKLDAWLKRERISVHDFAESIGCTREAVYLWIAGKRLPRYPAMKAIARLTKGAVSPDDLERTANGGGK